MREATEKSDLEQKKVKKVLDKYKGMKNKFNPKPALEPQGTTTVSSHVAGAENVEKYA